MKRLKFFATKEEWQAVKPSVLPLLRSVQPRIVESLKCIHAFDGQTLPSGDWDVVRTIMFERDGYVCTYCGLDRQPDSAVAARMRLTSRYGLQVLQSLEGIEDGGGVARFHAAVGAKVAEANAI